ncbi:hypothetical protein H257_15763 [Aphanomyces astaci]|uniref:EF-hand domain-containing protein n=1 Tax=Aphanomyces astaci TaxID=112090 RepID=W4FMP8_APHAT|nr:hypothetical protein H257_15763 [Aphanomyces astaci]ETV68181.1 hypothetical protein H257_15763 [Aphanomyces astaci]|eukprot:XP_009842266.1 hypothetical protein H257_15763 [Aphanomyces astaci]
MKGEPTSTTLRPPPTTSFGGGGPSAFRSARMSRRAAASAAAWRSRDADVDEAVVTPASSTSRLDISRVCRVAISRHGTVRDLLLHPDMPLEELYGCLRAIFPHVNTTPIALKNEANTLFPLSLLAHHPSTFSRAKKEAAHVSFELVCLGDPDVSYSELTRPVRVGWHAHGPHELTQFTLPQLIRAFRHAAPTGALDRSTFHKTLPSLVPSSSSSAPDDENGYALLSRVFDVFDKERTGVVDVVEFVSGLSVLVPGDRDDKIQATFSLYDHATPGFIGRDDMTTYLTSVYLVVAELNPDVFATNHVDPIQLGHVTAAQCFEDADVNHDGRLSYAEFQTWYSKTHLHNHQPHARKLKKQQHDISQRHQPLQVKWTLSAVRDLTGLGDYTVDEMLLWFPNSMSVTEADFLATMQRILQRQRKPVTVQTSALLRTLFGLFDADQNGVLNALELKIGLSVLCHPDPYGNSVRASFNLMDSNGDGHISLPEMTLYLRCVFRVLHGVTNAHVPVAPDVLAALTAQNMFDEADLNHDGKISFDEFYAWYTAAAPPTTALPTPPPLFPGHIRLAHQHQLPSKGPIARSSNSTALERVGILTNLNWRHPLDVFEVVALYVNADGVLTKTAFDHAFTHLLHGSTTPPAQARLVVDQLFRAFDGDGDGVVDFCELSSGLSLLCAGSQEEKVHAAFTLYDVNKDSFISHPELVSYLTAVFRVIYAFGSDLPQLPPMELADATAADAFARFDSNHDGQLSLAEFTAWYQTTTPTLSTQPFDLACLRDVRRVTRLGQYAVADIFSFFQASATDGAKNHLTKAQFFRCFNKLLSKVDEDTSRPPPQQLKATLDQLFIVFDSDGNGVVDTKELAAGLSLLCGGTHQDKVQAAFSLYDTNGDGFISRDEMVAYLTSVFKVLLQTSPALQAQLHHVAPSQLAVATTSQAFATCDVNHDDKLSMEEFTAWYQQQHHHQIPSKQQQSDQVSSFKQQSDQQEPPLSQTRTRELLDLGHLTVDALVDLCRDRLSAPVTSEKEFTALFDKLLLHSTNEAKKATALVQYRLFASLTSAFASFVPGLTYQDVACGLSVLTNDQNKVRATFSLMDRDGDLALSADELLRYFTAVFAVMYVVEPPTAMTTGNVSPAELARITAQHTMDNADTNDDHTLSLAEFQRWYTQDDKNAILPESALPLSLQQIRHITALGYLDVEDAFEHLADCADDAVDSGGCVTLDAFAVCLTNLAAEFHGHVPPLLASVATALFRAFDQDRVEFAELAAGLSVLCKGTRQAKVQAAFSLYDYNSDGYISMDEMTRYLTAVFRVLYVLHPNMAADTGVSAVELGQLTADEAFAFQPDSRRLSLAEFAAWFAKHEPNTCASLCDVKVAPKREVPWTLDAVRRHTKLMFHRPQVVFELFAQAAHDDGHLDQAGFDKCFRYLMGNCADQSKHDMSTGADQSQDDTTETQFLRRLFALFDSNEDGRVDFSELSAGLSILCAGSKEDKVQAAFVLFDLNGDGSISLEEMTQYLTSVFRVLFELSDQPRQLNGVSPVELATVTAAQAFHHVDLNPDGRIRLDEFKRWYSSPHNTTAVLDDPRPIPDNNFHMGFSLQEARRVTQLERHAPDVVLELLADCADASGVLTKLAFTECFQVHFLSSGADDTRALAVVHRLFDIFDTDGNGTVDYAELTAGLSLLCGGGREDKVRAAFALYDYNHDGVISLDEMIRYLTAVFKVLFATNPALLPQMQVTPLELAQVTAEQAFLECDINQDGKLTLDEFHAWYTQSNKPIKSSALSIPLPSLAQVHHFTDLGTCSPADVIERFRQFATANQLTRAAFSIGLQSFAKPAHKEAVDAIASHVFDLFDTDGNGVVDFVELGAGLCVLCGGSQEDKVRAAFALYDLNHTISRSEMALYLSSVFKVLFHINPETHRQMQDAGITPEELGTITADQAFIHAEKESDGVLSLDEFRRWYQSTASQNIQVPSLQRVKQVTNLHKFSPSQVFAHLTTYVTDPRGLDRRAFDASFATLRQLTCV